MTVPEILDEAALRLGDHDRQIVDNQILTRLLSRAQARVARKTFAYRNLFEITTVEAQAIYALPSGFIREFGVYALNSDGGTQVIEPKHNADSLGLNTDIVGSLLFYAIESGRTGDPGFNLAVSPAYPRSGDTIEVDCALITSDVNESDTALELPDVVHEAILWEVVANAAEIPRLAVPDRRSSRYRILADRAIKEAIASETYTSGQQSARSYPI